MISHGLIRSNTGCKPRVLMKNGDSAKAFEGPLDLSSQLPHNNCVLHKLADFALTNRTVVMVISCVPLSRHQNNSSQQPESCCNNEYFKISDRVWSGYRALRQKDKSPNPFPRDQPRPSQQCTTIIASSSSETDRRKRARESSILESTAIVPLSR